MSGLFSRESEDLTITRKMADGSKITIQSPAGTSMKMANEASGVAPRQRMAIPAMGQNYNFGGMVGYNDGGIIRGPRGVKYRRSVDGRWVSVLGNGLEVLVTSSKTKRWLESQSTGSDNSATGISQSSPWDGYADYNQQDFLDEAATFNNPGAQTADMAYRQPQETGQSYPKQVVLDPASTDPAQFNRMNQLVEKGMYGIERDRAGRAIYKLSDLGNSHNVRATGSGVENMGAVNQGPRDVHIPQVRPWEGSGRGPVNEETGAREDYGLNGPATDNAPTITPEGNPVQFRAGQTYTVASKKQAEEFVGSGVVEAGAIFKVSGTEIEGVAK